MCKIKSVPNSGIVPSVGRKKIVSIDFLDLLLTTSENATLVKTQIEFPAANNATEFIAQLKYLFLEKYDLSQKSNFYINIDCPENMEELTMGHIFDLLSLFQEPYKGQLLWGCTTSHESHYSVGMLIQS